MDIRPTYTPTPIQAATRATNAQSDNGTRKKSEDSSIERKEAEHNSAVRRYSQRDHKRLVDITV